MKISLRSEKGSDTQFLKVWSGFEENLPDDYQPGLVKNKKPDILDPVDDLLPPVGWEHGILLLLFSAVQVPVI